MKNFNKSRSQEIKKIIKIIEKIWFKHPELRLAQIMCINEYPFYWSDKSYIDEIKRRTEIK